MVTGHAAVALWVHSRRVAIPIALLLVAAYFADILEAALYWIGSMGWPAGSPAIAHELTTLAAAAAVLGLVAFWMTKHSTDGLIVAAVVLSHWALDFLTGLKPTWPGGPVVGLCLYDHLTIDFAIETLLIVIVWLAVRRARVPGRLGDWRLYAALVVVQLAANTVGALTRVSSCASLADVSPPTRSAERP